MATYDSADVGTTKTITIVYTLAGADATNYIKPVDGSDATGVITAIQLTIAAPSLTSSKTYDGNTTAAVTAGSLTGVVSGDDVTVNAVATYDSAAVGTGKTITVVYTLLGDDKANYVKPVDYQVATGAITAIQLTVATPSLTTSKAYDGNTSAAVTAGSLVGVISGDDVTVNAVANYSNATVGTGKTIMVAYTLGGTKAANYVKPENYQVATGAITLKQLTVAGPTLTTSKAYDGNTSAAVTAGSLTGVVSGETVTVSAVATYDTGTVGTSKTITVVYTLAGANAGNYVKPENHQVATGVITALPITAIGAVTGTAKFGSELTSGLITPAGATVSYQWKRCTTSDGTYENIDGATSSTYTPVELDIAKYLKVTATGTGNYSSTVTSTATGVVAKADSPLAPIQSIIGWFAAPPAIVTTVELYGLTASATNLEAAVALNGSVYSAYASLIVNGRGAATISGLSGITTATKVRVRIKETATTLVGAYKEITITQEALTIGALYQGGELAYIFQSGNAGYVADQIHGLIVSVEDLNTIPWAIPAYNQTEVTGTSYALGSGMQNTNRIIAQHNGVASGSYNSAINYTTLDSSYAAGLARGYNGGGYGDWFLPSSEEMYFVYLNKTSAAMLSGIYWTSSESTQPGFPPTRNARGWDAPLNNWVYVKSAVMNVRSVRNF
ncbi:MAG: hypothetical protein CVV52_11520 [Spirochaetae bacterium HGW-Spirochaetae-8]|nr:MAG: hypothetical protein CVV52_11520 [Spirochaetae bacterium HGW-Spirochaetae-8]